MNQRSSARGAIAELRARPLFARANAGYLSKIGEANFLSDNLALSEISKHYDVDGAVAAREGDLFFVGREGEVEDSAVFEIRYRHGRGAVKRLSPNVRYAEGDRDEIDAAVRPPPSIADFVWR